MRAREHLSTGARVLWLSLFIVGLVGCDVGLPTEEEPGEGIISGTITDASNAMIPNATIALRGTAERNIVAAAGVYSFNQLRAGSYSVTINAPPGYEVAANTNGTVSIQIVGSESKTVNFKVSRSATTTARVSCSRVLVLSCSQPVPPQARE
jgi:hypothetical protein